MAVLEKCNGWEFSTWHQAKIATKAANQQFSIILSSFNTALSKNEDNLFEVIKSEFKESKPKTLSIYVLVEISERPIMLVHFTLYTDQSNKKHIVKIFNQTDAVIDQIFMPRITKLFENVLEIAQKDYEIKFISSNAKLDDVHKGVEVTQQGLNLMFMQ